MPDGYEYVDGEWVEKTNIDFESGFTETKLIRILSRYLDQFPIAEIASVDASFCCFPHKPKQIRKPDCAIILCDPKSFIPPRTNFTQAPDLVVEVASPNDTFTELEQRIDDFITSGTRLAWIIDPEQRTASIYSNDGTTQRLKGSATLSGESVLPGFTVSLEDLFGIR